MRPPDGTAVDLQVHTPGVVITPGERLHDIAPSGDRLVVEARVDPADIDVVHPGLRAAVRLTPFNRRSFVAGIAIAGSFRALNLNPSW